MPEEESIKDRRSGNEIINQTRRYLVDSSSDIRRLLVRWASDPYRAATDISINSLMEAHLHITEAIKALNKAQRHTEE